jgi:TIR domain
MMNIFISYRRQDSGGHAGRLADRLVARFGAERVFMDIQDIAPGQNFAQSIAHTLALCTHVVALIGPQWLATLRARAPVGEDFVHDEIVAALARGLTVIPVLVGGARMPTSAELPAALGAFGRCQALEIRDERFDDDVIRLLNFLQPELRGDARSGLSRRAIWGSIAGALLLVLAGVTWRFSGDRQDSAETASFDVSGSWIAEMQKAAQPVFRIRLSLVQAGDQLLGSVRYPTGEGAISEGHARQGRLTFQTSHVPQFASAPAVVQFQGEVTGETIRLISSDSNGVATGVARRVSGTAAAAP